MNIHKNIRLLSLFKFFSGFKFYSAVGIIYFVHVTGSYALGLLVYSIASISSSLFEVPTGIFSDRIGRKKTIVYGAGIKVLAIICYAIGHSFFILAIGSVFGGLADALFSGNNEALLFDSVQESKETGDYAEHAGNISSMSQFAPAIAGVFGGFLAEWSFAYLMWISVLPQLICFFISLLMVEPVVHYSKISGNIFKNLHEAVVKFKNNYKLRTLSLASIIEYGVGETMYSFTPAFFGSLWPLWSLGIAKGLSNVLGGIGYRIAGKVMKKFSAAKTMFFGEVFSSVLNFVAVIFPSIFSPLICAFTAIPWAINDVARDSLMQLEFSDEQRATMGSLNSLCGNVFFAGFAFLFGLLADKLSTAHTLLVGEFLLLPIIYLYWKLFRKHQSDRMTPIQNSV